jgi:hypothetical protein
MRADHHQHPFDRAWATWQAWSAAGLWRGVLDRARAKGEEARLREELPDLDTLLGGPGPLAALAANRELVQTLTGWRWQAMRDAREQGHPWAEIGRALGVGAEQARHDYTEAVSRQRQAAQDPELARLLGYDPAWAELAADPPDREQPTSREADHER